MFSAGRVLLMPKGAYNPLTTYEMLDIVSYNGSSYIAKGTTTGNLPTDTTYWQLSAYGGQAANMAGNFAELESSSVATATHYVDDIFVDENSQLMKATQTINIGDTIDANVNCAPTTVEALIAYLSSYVDSLDSLNKKIQGAIEIAAQTDLHSLAIGEYYKKQTTFYVTNAPTGINQEASAIFRLTVEAALDNASQASSPLLLTLRTPDGKIYTQGFDGTNWGSWEQIAVESSVADVDTRVDSVESSVADVETSSTASKAYAIGKSFYYNDVLYKATAAISQGGTIIPGTNCTPEKIIEKIEDLVSENQTLTQQANAMVNVLGAKNLLPNYATTTTSGEVTFTVNDDGTIVANSSEAPTGWCGITLVNPLHLKAGKYLVSGSNGGAQTTYFVKVMDADNNTDIVYAQDGDTLMNLTSDTNIKVFVYCGTGITTAISNLEFKPMIRDARIADSTYEPYAMTNQELTQDVSALENVVNGGYKLTGYKNIFVTGDGVKTYNEKLYELALALKAYFETKPTNWRADYRLIYTDAVGTLIPNLGNQLSKNSSVTLVAMFYASNIIRYINVSNAGQNWNTIGKTTLSTNGITVDDLTNQVLPDTKTISVQLVEYEIISL